MSKLVIVALVISIVTLMIAVYSLALTISGVTCLIDAFLSVASGNFENFVVLSCPVMIVLSLMLSLIARREAESIVDTAINYVEEFEGKLNLALAYTSSAISMTSLILLLLQLIIASIGTL